MGSAQPLFGPTQPPGPLTALAWLAAAMALAVLVQFAADTLRAGF